MFNLKFILALSLFISFGVSAQMSTSSISKYFSDLRKLPDADLVNYMSRLGSFGTCKFQNIGLLPSASIKYKIVAPYNEIIAISPAALLTGNVASPVIGIAKPTNIASSITTKSHFNDVRLSLANLSLPESFAAKLVRDRFLKINNPCGIQASSIPGTGDESIVNIDPSKVTFYKSTILRSAAGGTLRCKSKVLSAKIFNSNSCSYEQKDKALPTSVCSSLYNRFKKSELPNVSMNTLTAAIAQDFATLQVAATYSVASEIASSKLDIISALPAAQLAQIENLDSVSACISNDCKNLAATISQSTGSSFQVESTVLASAQQITGGVATNLTTSPVLIAKEALATQLDAQATLAVSGLVANATPITRFATALRAPCMSFMMAAPVSHATTAY